MTCLQFGAFASEIPHGKSLTFLAWSQKSFGLEVPAVLWARRLLDLGSLRQ